MIKNANSGTHKQPAKRLGMRNAHAGIDGRRGLLAIPNLIAVLLLHRVVIDVTKRYFIKRDKTALK